MLKIKWRKSVIVLSGLLCWVLIFTGIYYMYTVSRVVGEIKGVKLYYDSQVYLSEQVAGYVSADNGEYELGKCLGSVEYQNSERTEKLYAIKGKSDYLCVRGFMSCNYYKIDEYNNTDNSSVS